jgi:hypothetical protein
VVLEGEKTYLGKATIETSGWHTERERLRVEKIIIGCANKK